MNEIQRHLDVLELPPGASWDDISSAYRELIKIWHPDRFAHDERLRARAEIKSKQLNEAVRQLRRHFRRTRLYKRSDIQGAVPGAQSGVFRSYRDQGFKDDLHKSFGRGTVEQRFDAQKINTSIYRSLARREKRLRHLTWVAGTCVGVLTLALLVVIGAPNRFFSQGFLPNTLGVSEDTATGHYRVLSSARDEKKTTTAGTLPRSTLIEAAANCKVEIVEKLLGDGEDINVTDQNGDSALAWAARRNCVSVAKVLIDHKIKIDTVARNGFSPKDWANWAKSSKVSALLSDEDKKTHLK